MSILPEDFYIRRVCAYENTPCFYMPKIKIPQLDVTYCIKGNMTYYVNDERFELESGDVLVLTPGSIRIRYRSSERITYTSFIVMVPDGFTPRMCGKIKGALTADALLMLNLAAKEWKSTNKNKQEKLKAIFTYLYSELDDICSKKSNAYVEGVKKYISKNLFSPIPISALANISHLTPQYLCTLFKENTGLTIIEYINNERISFAQTRMVTEKTPMNKISASCGFSDYNYFAKVFRQIVGISPSEYRKKFKK